MRRASEQRAADQATPDRGPHRVPVGTETDFGTALTTDDRSTPGSPAPVRASDSASALPGKIGRIVQIDALRGLMLVIMTTNHLLYGPFDAIKSVTLLTDEPLGFVSGAEGFFFLSGLVAGIVFGNLALQNKLAQLRLRAFIRARDIYLTNVVAFFLIASSAFVHNLWFAPAEASAGVSLLHQNPLLAFGLGVAFLHLPSLLDVLPLYFGFLLATPWMVGLLRRGHLKALLAGSFIVWALAQLYPTRLLQDALSPTIPAMLGYFDPFAWQVLFVLGLGLGFLLRKGKLPKALTAPRPIVLILATCVAGVFFVLRHQIVDLGGFEFGRLNAKQILGPIKLINFAVLCYLIAFLARRFKSAFDRKWLAFLGRHSLTVFAYHAVMVYLLKALHDVFANWNPLVDGLLVVLLVFSLSLPALAHRLWRERMALSRSR